MQSWQFGRLPQPQQQQPEPLHELSSVPAVHPAFPLASFYRACVTQAGWEMHK